VTFERDPDEEVAARARLAVVALSLPGAGWADATWLPSDSNDAWRRDDAVLRICWRGDRERLRRETLLARDLPPEMLHPGVIAAGEHAGMPWQLMRFVPGHRLADAWLTMEPRRLRTIVTQLAQLLQTLHAWNPTDAVRDSLAEREASRDDPAEHNLLPLPVEQTVRLIDRIASLPYVDPTLVRAVERRLGLLADIDPFARAEPRAVVHGDAQVSNLVVDDHHIAALLDYEWCRMAPVDSELAIWLHVLRITAITSPGNALPPVLRWLREDYPALFAHPDLEGRLWLYALAFTLRGLLVWPPDAPESELIATHHLHALRALADAPPEAAIAM